MMWAASGMVWANWAYVLQPNLKPYMQPIPESSPSVSPSESLFLASHSLPATSSGGAGEIPPCGWEKLLCWTAPHSSLPFLPLPSRNPSPCSQNDCTGHRESLCRRVEESRRSYHCKALTAASLPIPAAATATSSAKMSSSDGTFSIPPFPLDLVPDS